jgi:hypothetical protein
MILGYEVQPTLFFFETVSHVGQAGLELTILQSWNYRHAPPCLATYTFLIFEDHVSGSLAPKSAH